MNYNNKISVFRIEEKDDSKTKKKGQSAEEVAKAMVENMKANMENPNFLNEQEEIRQNALDEVLKKRKERQGNEK